MGGLVLFILDDSIREAKWLTEEEKTLLEQNIAKETRQSKHATLWSMLGDVRVWLISLILLLAVALVWAPVARAAALPPAEWQARHWGS